MAKQYRMSAFRRGVNAVASFVARRGKGPSWELTTVGRKSGRLRTVPVTPIEVEGSRYLVSPYGTVGWVHNIRATGTGTLRRGGQDEEITVTEVGDEEAGIVLARYHDELKRIVGAYFDVPDDPGVADFVVEATAHPVFRIDG